MKTAFDYIMHLMRTDGHVQMNKLMREMNWNGDYVQMHQCVCVCVCVYADVWDVSVCMRACMEGAYGGVCVRVCVDACACV